MTGPTQPDVQNAEGVRAGGAERDGADLAQSDLLGDVAVAVPRELGALAPVGVPRLQAPLPLPLPAAATLTSESASLPDCLVIDAVLGRQAVLADWTGPQQVPHAVACA